MAYDHDSTFQTLRELLSKYGEGLAIDVDGPDRFCLVATPGPMTLKAWGGKTRRATIPVAWVEREKSYVGFHLMGLNGNAPLVAGLSPALRARMQGKTCFNFRQPDPALFLELDGLTKASLDALRRERFVDALTRQPPNDR
jgi:hypothetical protein